MNAARAASRVQPSGRAEVISHGGSVLCMIVRAEPTPAETTFYTPYHFNLQVGKVVYPGGSEIPRHAHRSVTRDVVGTTEVLVVQKGRMIVDVYTDDHALVCSREVGSGDVVILLGAGHGFRLLEDTVLLEVKQGPYVGVQEKELF